MAEEPIEQNYALIIQQPGKAEQTLAKFVKLLLSYKYGLNTEIVTDFTKVRSVMRRGAERMRCAFVIQNKTVSARSTIPALTDQGRIPLFLVLPGYVANEQTEDCEGLENVFVSPWEMSFTTGSGSLQSVIGATLVGDEDAFGEGDDEFEDRVRRRLDNLDTLPTLPAIVTHIMRLINDPKTTMAELEELLSSDPSIVLKVVQIANSAVFAGTTTNRRWNLNEAIVRLGLRKVGAIAQQIALINSFVRPDDSEFEMQRFWEHSVACAIMADKLCAGGHVVLAEEVQFNDYWICALLHDCGKLVQGFFFWDWFERILRTMQSDESSYHEAENELMGGMVSHEFIGELLLRKANMPNSLVRAIGLHHVTSETPGSLVSLIHVANGLVKEMGLGYLESETSDYTRHALDCLKIGRPDLRRLKDELGDTVTSEVTQLVKQCMS